MNIINYIAQEIKVFILSYPMNILLNLLSEYNSMITIHMNFKCTLNYV